MPRGSGPIAAALAALLGATLFACSESPASSFSVDLAGKHRFRDGDDLAFASVELDDSQWETQHLPGGWRSTSLTMPEIRWLRLRFSWPEEYPTDGLALLLGQIGWTDQTYLNGRLIGATGWDEEIPPLAYLPRLYRIPDGALQPGANVIALRTRGAPLGPSGLLSDHIGIGPELALERALNRELSTTITIESILLGIFLFVWLLLAVLSKRGVTGRAALFLWILVTTQIIHLSLGSVTGRMLGLSQGGATSIRFLAVCIGISSLWAFIAILARGHLPRIVMGLMAVACSLGVAGLMTSELGILASTLLLMATCVDFAIFVLLFFAARARTPGAIPALVGYVGALTFIWLMIGLKQPFFFGIGAYYFGIGWLAVGGLIALARQVDVARKRAQRTAEYALAAHTSERSRLARDLHDGLGQMLALLKMQLQRTGRRLEDDKARTSVEEGVAQVDATLEEMRRIARDLRPAPLQERGFAQAVRDYATAMARRSGIEVVVEGDIDSQIPETVGEELYRVVQECLTNCLKHSEASRVTVSMTSSGDGFLLTITDNGRGLPEELTGPGIGLQTIRERSELLGGACHFVVPEGGGTRVEISVSQPSLAR